MIPSSIVKNTIKTFLDFKRKILTWSEIWTSDLHISNLQLYHLSYPGSIDGSGLYLSLENQC